jgi:uncharacterized protein YecE (DUF72 family)
MYVWIGTSGYSYQDWVGDFYPRGTRPEQMLAYYGRHFPVVELNFTFYRAPTWPMLLRLAEKAPPGLQFVVKLPKTVSHDHSPMDLPGFRHAVEGLAGHGQLLGLLAQFPQAMHCTRPACDWITTLGKELGHLHLAIELRHRSWSRPGLGDWLAEQGLDLVAVDVPDLPGLFPRGWVQSGPTAYLRLHSRNAEKWYKSGEERYDYEYSDDELGEWAEELARRHDEGTTEKALLLFNNCQRGQAARNARRMQALLGERAPQLDLVAPFGNAPVQRTLFE